MRFEVLEQTRWPRQTVFDAHRDDLEKIAKYLPDIEKVELRSRSRSASGLEVQKHWWTGSASALPAMVRSMVPPQLLQWNQTTTWDPVGFVASWEIEVPGLREVLTASGRNVYLDKDGVCHIALEGDFTFRPDKMPELRAIPSVMAPFIEKAVVKLIVPMIQRTGTAVAKYLDERDG